LVPRPSGVNVISGKWIFRIKYKEDGSLDRYKARWVFHGFFQRAGIDYGKTYCPVVKSATVRTVLALASSCAWLVHQLDVNNAFLHGFIDENIYTRQPASFVHSVHGDRVCKLNKNLCGLKQAPRTWYTRFASFLATIDFINTNPTPHCLFFVVAIRRHTSFYMSTIPFSQLHRLNCSVTSRRQSTTSSSSRTWGLFTIFSAFKCSVPARDSSFTSTNMHLTSLNVQTCKIVARARRQWTPMGSSRLPPARLSALMMHRHIEALLVLFNT
jgi:hypothetical protein